MPKKDVEAKGERCEVKKDDVIICLRGHEVGCDSTMFAVFLAVSVFLVSNTMTPTTNTAHCSIAPSAAVWSSQTSWVLEIVKKSRK